MYEVGLDQSPYTYAGYTVRQQGIDKWQKRIIRVKMQICTTRTVKKMCLGGPYMLATFVWCSTPSIVKSMTSGATKVILLVVSISLNQFSSAGIVSNLQCSFCRTEVVVERLFTTQRNVVCVCETMGGCSRS